MAAHLPLNGAANAPPASGAPPHACNGWGMQPLPPPTSMGGGTNGYGGGIPLTSYPPTSYPPTSYPPTSFPQQPHAACNGGMSYGWDAPPACNGGAPLAHQTAPPGNGYAAPSGGSEAQQAQAAAGASPALGPAGANGFVAAAPAAAAVGGGHQQQAPQPLGGPVPMDNGMPGVPPATMVSPPTAPPNVGGAQAGEAPQPTQPLPPPQHQPHAAGMATMQPAMGAPPPMLSGIPPAFNASSYLPSFSPSGASPANSSSGANGASEASGAHGANGANGAYGDGAVSNEPTPAPAHMFSAPAPVPPAVFPGTDGGGASCPPPPTVVRAPAGGAPPGGGVVGVSAPSSLYQLANSHAQLATKIQKFLEEAADEKDPAIVGYHGALKNVMGLLCEASEALVKATQSSSR